MLVAIDTETTGLNPFVHDILVAAIATKELYERILLQL